MMFVCNCNAITKKQVDLAINSGCNKPSDIYAACGKHPKCGKCILRMCDILSDQGQQKQLAESVLAE